MATLSRTERRCGDLVLGDRGDYFSGYLNERVVVRLGLSILLAPALIGLDACTWSPRPHARRASEAGARDSIEMAEAGLTDQYVKLLRDQLNAQDPYLAAVPIYCEQRRIIRLLTNQATEPLDGQNRAVELLTAAERRAFTRADKPARDRVDRALGGRVFNALVNCDSVARTGVLGDTVIPPLRQGRF